jgi:hypothetical protein
MKQCRVAGWDLDVEDARPRHVEDQSMPWLLMHGHNLIVLRTYGKNGHRAERDDENRVLVA